MRSLTAGHIRAGLDSVRGARVRNFWTMFGIIVGVASVITVVGIGQGIKTQISNQIHHFGKDLIIVQPISSNTGQSKSNLITGTNYVGSLSGKDLTAVVGANGVGKSAPLSLASGTVRTDNHTYTDGVVIGTTPDLPALLNQSMAYGDFLTKDDVGHYVAVIGEFAAQKIFNDAVPLGRTFSFRGQDFIVHGIFNQFDATPLSQQVDFNKAIFITYDVAASLTDNTALTFEILAKPVDTKQVTAVTANIKQALNTIHNGESDISVLLQSQNLAGNNAIVDLITRLIAGVAAISLLVGGVGIMNVMIVSVSERMREIGIRKAVGASNRQILSQFIIEATFLSFMGGIIGIISAFVIDLGLRLTTALRPEISLQLVAIATGVSIIVGIVFGSLPAFIAARKDPIEALRSN